MNKLILKQEVLDAYDGYVKAFIKGDTKDSNSKRIAQVLSQFVGLQELGSGKAGFGLCWYAAMKSVRRFTMRCVWRCHFYRRCHRQ